MIRSCSSVISGPPISARNAARRGDESCVAVHRCQVWRVIWSRCARADRVAESCGIICVSLGVRLNALRRAASNRGSLAVEDTFHDDAEVRRALGVTRGVGLTRLSPEVDPGLVAMDTTVGAEAVGPVGEVTEGVVDVGESLVR